MNLSIIIVNYNTKELLKKCLDSLFIHCKEELTSGDYEIIVVDNGSKEEIQNSKFKIQNYGRLIRNNENLGFAKANNIGIKEAKGDVVLLLNSDTEVKEGSVQGTVEFMGSKGDRGNGGNRGMIGAATCKVFLANGKIDPSCHRGFPTPWNAFCYFVGLEKLFPKIKLFSGYHQYYKDLNTAHEVDAISGAFFMVRREVIVAVGRLDEDYFMYGEDIDWCYRIKQAGYSVWYYPNYSIIHHKKKSGRDTSSVELKKKTQRYFWQTMRIFYEKHYEKKYPKIINAVVKMILRILS